MPGTTAKKFIKKGFSDDAELRYTKNAKETHDATVQGDIVGDPFKDAPGPALNIMMKPQAIVSLAAEQLNAGESCCGGSGVWPLLPNPCEVADAPRHTEQLHGLQQ